MMLSSKVSAPRGIRNNNPGNLENNGINWVGLSSSQADSRFYQFTEPKYGIRALARVLKTYESKYGLNTVEGIINRWAPDFENNTDAYIQHVSSVLGVKRSQPFDVSKNLVQLVEAIIIHENGSNPYSMDKIVEGVMLA
ncbi:MAG: structural protein [Oleiphilus sp.]